MWIPFTVYIEFYIEMLHINRDIILAEFAEHSSIPYLPSEKRSTGDMVVVVSSDLHETKKTNTKTTIQIFNLNSLISSLVSSHAIAKILNISTW